ncbi:hypothetical protein SynSYN20_01442 [Synechococcus sp. SYN20]|nr:hypothetical protein SynSYN20_01442 [Synechococcus sp. SYN20]
MLLLLQSLNNKIKTLMLLIFHLYILNALIFDCADCFLDFPYGKPAVASLAMKLLKPVSGELPRAEQEDRKKQPVHPCGAITVLKHAMRGK